MSARLILTASDKHKLKVVRVNAGNAFANTPTEEKLYAISGEEFEERQGCVVEITRRLHGMSTLSRSFSLSLGYFIRILVFVSSRVDL